MYSEKCQLALGENQSNELIMDVYMREPKNYECIGPSQPPRPQPNLAYLHWT